ncbi:hypothetical protein [Kitasatospora sp. NPDC050543]|uniref:hypothetical protein n=1 Tax=Kitasatospora sp. NPDC050543 TaxID=3364054 RepID=UPI00378C2920
MSVLVAGKQATDRPGAKPLTDEQKKEKARLDHRRLLRRAQEVEATSEASWYAPPYRESGIAARDYHRALPVVATTLPLLRAGGADAAIWRRFGRPGWHTLADALDNPDGDQLLEAERAAAEQARQEREREEHERRRPTCTRCGAKFPDERWAERKRNAWDDRLCADCRQADADQQARQAAEREQATAEAAAAQAKRAGSWWRRRS